MKGSESRLIAYMDGSDKRFIIPVYQREYTWKKENCEQLFEDLKKVVQYKRKSHFFGSIVSVNNGEGINEYLVIDGQQRLTSVTLLFLAMYNLIKNNKLIPEDKTLGDKIYETYLINKFRNDERKFRLRPVKDDKVAFERLFEDNAKYIPDSNLTINYNYFYSRILEKREITLDDLYDAITKLEIISITLNQDDDPQLIFESLNSTGVDLSEGDKIRNFILMGLTVEKQNKFYEKYWLPIEKNVGSENLSLFVRDYLSIQKKEIPVLNKIYFKFKEYVKDSGIEMEKLLQNMLRYSTWYETLLKGNTKNKELNDCIIRLNKLETTVTRPFFLEVLRMHDENILTLADVTKVFLYTENYIFRRFICGIPTNSLNKTFLRFHSDIKSYDGGENDFLEKFKYALSSKTDNGRFPNDQEFRDEFSKRAVYLMSSKNINYIFERFENYGTKEEHDIYKKCEDGTYTVEHIMPQNLTLKWKEDLGDSWEEIYTTWVNRLANLTLTGYNSEYSNRRFIEKRNMEQGFADSHLYINKWIGEQKQWGLTELEKRDKMLMKKALLIWDFPKTSYKPPKKQLDEYSLEDNYDYTGRDIARFRYRNTEHQVESWADMMIQVLQLLHGEDNSILTKIAYSTDAENELSQYVSTKDKKLRLPAKISENIFVEKNTNTAAKITILRKTFALFGVEESDLTFYLKDSDNSQKGK